MERCPCCNARLGGATVCPRCRTDLGKVLAAEQAAQFWLAKAIDHWSADEVVQSMGDLERSLQLKTNRPALMLRDFFIDRICQDILELLAQKRVLAAKKRLHEMRQSLPGNELLCQLNAFTDYLMVKD